jgi:uracil DNA glycosylase
MQVEVKEKGMQFEDFAPLLGEWADKFRPFIEGEGMYNIYQRIKKDAEKEIIVPEYDNVFRAFQQTSPGNIKSVWYCMDPYPKRYKNRVMQATGIAMDCSNSPDGKLQPSLEKFYEGMEINLGRGVENSKSLDYLCNQGIMMTNTDLTCKLNKTGSHEKLWEPFQKYFLEEVMSAYSGIVYVLLGKASARMERYIYTAGNYCFKLEHPVAASYKDTTWDCKKIFTKINYILSQNGQEKVLWDRKEWEAENHPPF